MCSIFRQPWGTSSTDVTLARLRIEKERSSWAEASQQTSVDHTRSSTYFLPKLFHYHSSVYKHNLTLQRRHDFFTVLCAFFLCRMQTPPSLLMKPCSLIAVYKTLTEEWTTCWAQAPASLMAWETRGARLRSVWHRIQGGFHRRPGRGIFFFFILLSGCF